MPDESEIERMILEKLLDDDPAGIEMIYEHFGGRLYGYLVSLVRSQSDAEELLNELFMTAVRKREHLIKAENMRAYLFTIARNLATDLFRKRGNSSGKLSGYAEYLEVREECRDGWGDDELAEARKAVDELPDEQREVVVLKIFDGITFEEISKLLGISQNTAASRYRYAVGKLRERMRRFGYE